MPATSKTMNAEIRTYGVQMSIMRAIEAKGLAVTYVDDLMHNLNLTKTQVQSAVSHILKRNTGHSIEVIQRGKMWRWNPNAVITQGVPEPKQEKLPLSELPTAPAANPARPLHKVPGPIRVVLDIVRETKRGDLLCEDENGDFWVARKI